jgi:metal-dependent amidase/aminoacylase/carboxypeptidase family protein
LTKRRASLYASKAHNVGNSLPSGKIGLGSGYRFSNADSVRITIYGKGGHGSQPNSTIDPIVIAARNMVALQTIVSREVKPGDFVTVGYIQAGTRNNILDQAELGLTPLRYKPEVRKLVLR